MTSYLSYVDSTTNGTWKYRALALARKQTKWRMERSQRNRMHVFQRPSHSCEKLLGYSVITVRIIVNQVEMMSKVKQWGVIPGVKRNVVTTLPIPTHLKVRLAEVPSKPNYTRQLSLLVQSLQPKQWTKPTKTT